MSMVQGLLTGAAMFETNLDILQAQQWNTTAN